MCAYVYVYECMSVCTYLHFEVKQFDVSKLESQAGGNGSKELLHAAFQSKIEESPSSMAARWFV